ncbi:hypothetical protein PUR61_10745 [Streptomyces sp. BE20]|uniref:hypothetical protein n=1 Tax=Streptomyces sp. BE20 TaxID=3002525 RepID=UPI002E781862|nr:hypothetical protein [Streptomyces sp. BE20]MEE1822666.1 hypothetical protein [Streptomyces sp. BE20]
MQGQTLEPVRVEHLPAPWVRTRLRSARSTAVLNAVLVLAAVFLTAALPRAVDLGADAALRDFLHSRNASGTSLYTTSEIRDGDDTAALAAVAADLASRTGGEFRIADSGPVYGVFGAKPTPLGNPGLARPDGLSPSLRLLNLAKISEHTTLVAGRWPTGAPRDRPLPIAVSAHAAEKLSIHLGDVLTEEFGNPAPELGVEVVGFYSAHDEADPYWTDLGCVTRGCLELPLTNEKLRAWQTTGVVGDESLTRLVEWARGGHAFWRQPVDPDSLRVDRLPRAETEINSYLTGPTAAGLMTTTGRPDLRTVSLLPQLFTLASERREAAAPLAAIGPAGLAGVVAVVLLLAAALAADRRTAEIRLLRARGGSQGGVLRRLLGEGAVTVLPAAGLGLALALLLLPTPRWGASVLAGTTVALVSLVAFPLRAAMLLSGPRPTDGRRRLVGELAVLAVTVAAVAEVRRRGVTPAGSGLDPLVVTTPLLIALAAGLLIARIQPLLVGSLARLVGRRRGVVGFLGLARAARGTGDRPRPTVLPVFALLLAVTTAGFGADMIDAVDSGRVRSSRVAVGGDVMLSGPTGVTLPDSFTAAAGALPGVTAATAVFLETDAVVLRPGDRPLTITAVVVDPVAYAAISRSLGRGVFDPERLGGAAAAAPAGGVPEPSGPPDTPVPALYSAGLVAALGGDADARRLRFGSNGEISAARTATVDATPALRDSTRPFVVLPAGPAVALLPELARRTYWYAVGDIDADAVRRLAHQLPVTEIVADTARLTGIRPAGPNADSLPEGYLMYTSEEFVAELTTDPLQHAASRIFRAATAGAGAFALLAVLLTLLRAAPDRAASLARLRTMGLRPRQGMALILTETLPQTLLAAAGGALAALTAVAVLGPVFDLSALLGTRVPPGLPVSGWAVVPPTLGLAALVAAGVLAEALVAGRRQIATELRVGDGN